MCHSWNRGRPCVKKLCPYTHYCRICRSTLHAAVDCDALIYEIDFSEWTEINGSGPKQTVHGVPGAGRRRRPREEWAAEIALRHAASSSTP